MNDPPHLIKPVSEPPANPASTVPRFETPHAMAHYHQCLGNVEGKALGTKLADDEDIHTSTPNRINLRKPRRSKEVEGSRLRIWVASMLKSSRSDGTKGSFIFFYIDRIFGDSAV